MRSDMRNCFAALLVTTVIAAPALAQTAAPWPAKSIRVIVPFPAGGAVDLSARTLAQKLAAPLGQPVVVDNRAGASTIIGTEAVAKAPPDGHTWLIVTNTIAINPSVFKKLPYDTLADLAPVTRISASPFILIVHPSLPVKSVADFIQLAKKRPGELLYSSSGIGSSNHVPVVLLNLATGVNTTHVPYKGTAQSLAAVVSGEVQFQFSNPIASAALVRAGKLRALATGGTRPLPSMPELPTVAQAAGIPGFQAGPWFGLFAPAATPRAIVTRMHGEVAAILAAPDVRLSLSAEGADIIGDSPEQFAAFMKAEIARWAKVVAAAGIKAE
jgi:tripartite-type tricarboxylate transporter receptor subunit TctC